MSVDIRRTLSSLGVAPKKQRGQNFLFHSGVLDTVFRFSGVSSGERVLEIGPGLGALTEKLLVVCPELEVFEVQEEFCRYLREQFFVGRERQVHFEDVREVSLEGRAAEPFVVVGNLPYSLSSEIVLWVLRNRKYISRASFLLQKEFAERIAATPGGKEYGSITALRTLLADARLGPVISGDSFYPKAGVSSQLLEIIPLEAPREEVPNIEFFERVVRASFATRRKTLLNALLRGNFGFKKEALEALLLSLDINPKRRAETLNVSEFAKLSSALS